MYNAKTMPASSTTHATNCSCSACNGVNCIERPRFFAGQCLEAKDLEAAQQYVIEKNKLHNRYLVGTGVASGLMVKCDPCCEGSVVIEPGYAIDCEGNDIVVCKEVSFDLLSYLKKQKHSDNMPYCGPGVYNRQSSRREEELKEYMLVISYAEEMAKPMTALVRDNGCNTSRCEPSRIRETFRFDLIETQIEKPELIGRRSFPIKNLTPSHSFLGQVFACFENYQEVVKIAQEFVGQNTNALAFNPDSAALSQAFKRARNIVLDLYQKEPNIQCNLPEKIAALEQKFNATGDAYEQRKVLAAILTLSMRLLLDCVCNALLMESPDCKIGEGVAIACITMQGNKIEKICNTARKQLLTGPSLEYWTQPLFNGIETLLHYICCDLDLEKEFNIGNG